MGTPKIADDFAALLDRLDFEMTGGRLSYRIGSLQSGALFLQVHCLEGKCNVTGERLAWKGRKWLLSRWMTDGEVVQTAFLATMTALEHEARENFKFDGVTVFDPHLDLEKLVEARKSGALPIQEREHV